RSTGSRRLKDLFCLCQYCCVEPPDAFPGQRVAFGFKTGDFVHCPLQIVLERIWRTGEIPSGRRYLLDHELYFIASPRMGFRPYSISITFVVVAQMPNSISIWLQ